MDTAKLKMSIANIFLNSDLHLPEDLEVRGFVGLKTALSKLDFLSGIGSGVPANMEHSCRCYRYSNTRRTHN